MSYKLKISYIHYCKVNGIILTGIIILAFFSCTPQVHVWKSISTSYPPREDNDSVVFYKKAEDIPIASKKIGTLQATCNLANNCDSASIFSLAETKIKKAGGNALLITDFEKPTFWNNYSALSLNGDVFLVSDFSFSPDTAKTKFENFAEKLYAGFGFGQETGLSLFLPKVSYYNFQDRKILSTYYGVEGCFGIIQRPMFSLDCLYGVKKNIFTLDASIGIWWLPKIKYDTISSEAYFHSTINPKVGIKFWKIWLKAGPSIHLYKNYPKGQEEPGIVNMGKIGNRFYNFEISMAF
jgi:hypothetical protein